MNTSASEIHPTMSHLLFLKKTRFFCMVAMGVFFFASSAITAQTTIFIPDWLGVRDLEDVTIKNVSYNANGKPKGAWRYTNNYSATNQHALFNYDTYKYTEFRVHKNKDYVEIDGFYDAEYKKDSIWNYYHEPGVISMTGSYKAGIKEGLWSHFDKEGTLTISQNYANGKLNGRTKRIVQQGPDVFTIETDYINDKEDGKVEVIVDPAIGDDYIYRSETYKDGFVVGEMKFYNPDSTIYESFSYDGKSKEPFEKKTYYPNGQVHEITGITSSERSKEGVNTVYYTSGKLNMKLYWQKNKLMNVILLLDEQGNKLDYGTLKDGNGTFLLYDEEGEKQVQFTIVDGEIVDKLEF